MRSAFLYFISLIAGVPLSLLAQVSTPGNLLDPEDVIDPGPAGLHETLHSMPGHEEFSRLRETITRLIATGRQDQAVARCDEALAHYSESPSIGFLCAPVLAYNGRTVRIRLHPQELLYRKTEIALRRFDLIETQMLALGVPESQLRRLELVLESTNQRAGEHELDQRHVERLTGIYSDIALDIARTQHISRTAAYQLLADGARANLKLLGEYCRETDDLSHLHAIFDATRSRFSSQLEAISFGDEGASPLCSGLDAPSADSARSLLSEQGDSFRQCMEDLAYADRCIGGLAAQDDPDTEVVELDEVVIQADTGSEESGDTVELPPVRIKADEGSDPGGEASSVMELEETTIEVQVPEAEPAGREFNLEDVDVGGLVKSLAEAGGGIAIGMSVGGPLGAAIAIAGGVKGGADAADAVYKGFIGGTELCPETYVGPIRAGFHVAVRQAADSIDGFSPEPGRIPFRRALEYCACRTYGDDTPDAPALGIETGCGGDGASDAFDGARAESEPNPPGFTPPEPEQCAALAAGDNEGTIDRVFEQLCQRIQCPGNMTAITEAEMGGVPFCSCIVPGGGDGDSGAHCRTFDCVEGVAVWKNGRCVCEETEPPIAAGAITLVPGRAAAGDRVILDGLPPSIRDSLRQTLGASVHETDAQGNACIPAPTNGGRC